MTIDIEQILKEYFAEYGSKDERDRIITEIFVACIQHCPEVLMHEKVVNVPIMLRALEVTGKVEPEQLNDWDKRLADSPNIVIEPPSGSAAH